MSSRSLCALALGLFSACHGGGAPPAAIASQTIGPAGGTLTVAAGELAGLAVIVPPGALAAEVELSVDVAVPLARPGFVVVGRAAVLGPMGLEFALPVDVTLPFDAAKLLGSRVVVLAETSGGRVVEIAPAAIPTPGRASCRVRSTGLIWAAERYLGGVATQNFLPLADGDTWVFQRGITATMQFTTTEPNLGGAPVYRLEFATAQSSYGFYLQATANGFDLLGEFSAMGGDTHQILHAAAPFLPGQVTMAQPVDVVHAADEIVPYGAMVAPTPGTRVAVMLPRHLDSVATKLGEFTDVLRLDATRTFVRPDGTRRDVTFSLFLQRGVGPIALSMFGTSATIESGIVGGAPVQPPS